MDSNINKIMVVIPSPVGELIFSSKKTKQRYAQEYFDRLYDVIFDSVKSYNSNIVCCRGSSRSDAISSNLIRELADADVVFVIVTGRSSNIFWQLGVRHALKQGTVILQDVRDQSPLGLVGYIHYQYEIETSEGVDTLKSLVRDKLSLYNDVILSDSPVRSIVGGEFTSLVTLQSGVTSRSNYKENTIISILFLAADPTNASRLRLGEELREIEDQLRFSRLRDRFDIQQRLSVRPRDLVQFLLDRHPQIVHFSGHGLESGELCFEDQLGGALLVHPAALAELFQNFSESVKCVILNACYSNLVAGEIAKHIDFVIGMKQAIGDRAAIMFSTGFYQALGGGCSIERAYQLGCIQIRLHGIPEHLTPVLLKRTPEHPKEP